MDNVVRFLAYALLFVVCTVASRSPGCPRGARVVLLAIGTVGLLLGLAEVLEVGGWVSDQGRSVAWSDGWYRDRRRVQALVVVAIAAVTVVAAFTSAVALKAYGVRMSAVAALGMILLGFIAARTVSLHQLDHYFYAEVAPGGLNLGQVAELMLVALLAAAILNLRWSEGIQGSGSLSPPV